MIRGSFLAPIVVFGALAATFVSADELKPINAVQRSSVPLGETTLLSALGCGAPQAEVKTALFEAPPQDGRLDILTVGSSSTAGVGAGGPGLAYPAVLARMLAERVGEREARIEVLVTPRGVSGERAAGALARLEKEIAETKPDLLVWQVGTNDAVAQVPVETLREEIRAGAAIAGALGLPMILVDPQYFPRIAGDDHYAAVVDAIAEVAADLGLPLVRRYERMRAAEDMGPEAVAALLASDRFHMSPAGHACLSLDIAEAVLPSAGAQIKSH